MRQLNKPPRPQGEGWGEGGFCKNHWMPKFEASRESLDSTNVTFTGHLRHRYLIGVKMGENGLKGNKCCGITVGSSEITSVI